MKKTMKKKLGIITILLMIFYMQVQLPQSFEILAQEKNGYFKDIFKEKQGTSHSGKTIKSKDANPGTRRLNEEETPIGGGGKEPAPVTDALPLVLLSCIAYGIYISLNTKRKKV
jgi:hypothetical protein